MKWISVKERLPELRKRYSDPAPYVLVIDAYARMSVAYANQHSAGHIWVMAKQIGEVTHWMPLPAPPESPDDLNLKDQENSNG